VLYRINLEKNNKIEMYVSYIFIKINNMLKLNSIIIGDYMLHNTMV